MATDFKRCARQKGLCSSCSRWHTDPDVKWRSFARNLDEEGQKVAEGAECYECYDVRRVRVAKTSQELVLTRREEEPEFNDVWLNWMIEKRSGKSYYKRGKQLLDEESTVVGEKKEFNA